MAGIYLHIPFCKQACHYCDFHFSTSLKNKHALLGALIQELAQRKDYLQGQSIETIYFGGGTPSILSASEIETLYSAIDKHFSINSNVEITLEANPDDLSLGYLKSLSSTPVNRLSIGIQSFDNEILNWMNRPHTASEAETCVRRAQDYSLSNISIDLIYGFPKLAQAMWEAEIQKVLELGVPHLSAYSLTVEPKTALAIQIAKKQTLPIDQELASNHFQILMSTLKDTELVHYEISNFGKEGFFSKHNTSYWKGVHYLGIGPAAHSFNGNSRQWNVANNSTYISSVSRSKPKIENEELSLSTRYNEYIMTSLRTIWGCDEDHIFSHFGNELGLFFQNNMRKHEKTSFFIKNGANISLTQNGKMMADRISSDLMHIEG